MSFNPGPIPKEMKYSKCWDCRFFNKKERHPIFPWICFCDDLAIFRSRTAKPLVYDIRARKDESTIWMTCFVSSYIKDSNVPPRFTVGF